MIEPGLLSITFRKLSADDIVALAVAGSLVAIEWGGDVHVPHGDVAVARRVRATCDDAGLRVSAYGSYYRAGVSAAEGLPFQRVLDSALALGTDTLRVWAGNVGSADASATQRAAVIDDLRRIAELSGGAGVNVSLEFHGGTLSDSADAALALLRAVGHPNLSTFWQPPLGLPPETCVAGLRAMLPHVRHVHVFHWWPDHLTRFALRDGADRWPAYLRELARDGRRRFASLEYVKDDNPQQCLRDAATLRQWLAEARAGDAAAER